MLKHFVVPLLVSVCLVSCQDREKERQQIMAEIERLDLLRKKVSEFVLTQEAALSAKQCEYAEWKAGHMATLKKYQRIIVDTGIDESKTAGALSVYQELSKEFPQDIYYAGMANGKKYRLNAVKKVLAYWRERS